MFHNRLEKPKKVKQVPSGKDTTPCEDGAVWETRRPGCPGEILNKI